MKFTPTELPEILIVEPQVHADNRGFFLEIYHRDRFERAGIAASFVQDNRSRSTRGTLRGLHAQVRRPQGKLVSVIDGEIFDVAVDIRRGSPNFGRWVGLTLTAESFRMLYIPPGFAHGYCVTSESAEIVYKCTDVYDPDGELAIAWNDPDLGVRWPVERPLLSTKDERAPRLVDASDRLPTFSPERT